MDIILDLQKASGVGLVPKQVQVTRKNGKTFTQTFMVSPNQAPINNQASAQVSTSNTSGFSLSKFESLKANKPEALKYLKESGVTWTESPHEGVNWMRASMASKKHTATNSTQQPLASTPITSPTTTSSNFDKAKFETLKSNRPEALKYLKDSGFIWKENPHEGVNWMQAMMAVKNFSSSSTKDTSSSVQQLTTDMLTLETKIFDAYSQMKNAKTADEYNNANKLKLSLQEEWFKVKDKLQAANGGVLPQHPNSTPIKTVPVVKPTKTVVPVVSKADQIKSSTEQYNKLAMELKPLSIESNVNNNPNSKRIAEILTEMIKVNDKVFELTGKRLEKPVITRKDKVEHYIAKATTDNAVICKKLGMLAQDEHAQNYLNNFLMPHFEDMVKKTSSSSSSANAKQILDGSKANLKGVVNATIVTSVKGLTDPLARNLTSAITRKMLYSPWVDPETQMPETQIFSGITKTLEILKDTIVSSNNISSSSQNKLDNIEHVLEHLNGIKKILGDSPFYPEFFEVLIRTARKGYRIDFWEINTACEEIKRKTRREIYSYEQGTVSEISSTDDLKLYKDKLDYFQQFDNSSSNKWDEKYELKRHFKNIEDFLQAQYGDKSLILNLHYFNKACSAVKSNKWSIKHDLFKDLPQITDSESETFSLRSATSEDKQKLVEELSLNIGSFNPKFHKTPNSDISSVKTKLNSVIEDNKKLLKDYGITNPLLSEGDIKCTLAYVSTQEFKDIKAQILKDWDNVHHGGMVPIIKGVFKIENLEVEDEFQKLKQDRDNKSKTFYHGTGSYATTLILGKSGQFKHSKVKAGRMLGDGIYLADQASKSAQYIDDKGVSRHNIEGSLMICEATLGTISNDSYTTTHDTVEAKTSDPRWQRLRNNEWCVRNPKAVIPRYLIHMEVK